MKVNPNKQLQIIIEKRGAKEDKKLMEHFQKICARGTGYVTAERLKALKLKINFRGKNENINGLQLSDLIAYPIAAHAMNPKRVNQAYELIEKKIYTKDGKLYGLKVFP